MGVKIVSQKYTEAGGSATEIVTVAEVKTYLQIEGTAYDGPLAIFISAARRLIEEVCGISLMEKTAVVTFQSSSYKHLIRLLQFPVDAVVTVAWRKCPSTWVELVLDEDYYLVGDDQISVQSNYTGLHKITYSLGVDDGHVWPQAIQAQAAFMFNNRDAKVGAIAPEVQALLQPFVTIS